tara:strand:+ start:2186 stop:2341 length:156 start_codon:yes stop_codon:yes gene_type:complete
MCSEGAAHIKSARGQTMMNRALLENVTNDRVGIREARKIKKQTIRQRRLQH